MRTVKKCCVMLLIIGGMLPATPFELEASENRVVNFANDIAPIIHEKCSNCHRKGQVGPFELISFQDVRRKQSGEQPTNFSNDHFKEFDRFHGHTDAFKTKTCLTAKI